MTLRRALRDFVQAKSLCPPVSLKQLEALAEEFHVSTSTVFYVINGYPTTRKRKRRTSLRKTAKAIN